MGRRKKSEYEQMELTEDGALTEEAQSEPTADVSESEPTPAVQEVVPLTETEVVLTEEQKFISNVDAELSEIFGSCARTSVPTLISYKPKGSAIIKHVIVDINVAAIEQGWKRFLELVPSGTAEDYLLRVYQITHTAIPRMYRAVAITSLVKN